MPHRKVLLHRNGPALWPKHKPLEEVLYLQATTPERVWEGTYQGNPVAPKGSIFKRAWWDFPNPTRFDPAALPRLNNQIIARWISFDTAQKDEDENAYTAAVVGELLPDYRLLLRYVWRDRLIFPDLPPAISNLANKYRHDGKTYGVIIEDKASGISAIQTLRKATEYEEVADMLITFTPLVDKATRANQASVWCKNGMVLLPYPSADAPWLHDFEDEIFGFPNSTYADQVDAFVQLILYLENILAEGFQLRSARASASESLDSPDDVPILAGVI